METTVVSLICHHFFLFLFCAVCVGAPVPVPAVILHLVHSVCGFQLSAAAVGKLKEDESLIKV